MNESDFLTWAALVTILIVLAVVVVIGVLDGMGRRRKETPATTKGDGGVGTDPGSD